MKTDLTLEIILPHKVKVSLELQAWI